MGLLGKLAVKVVEGAAKAVGADLAMGALDVAEKGVVVAGKGIEAGAKITSKATEIAKNSISDIREMHNLSELKKQAKKTEYSLFVKKESSLGEGIYKITNKKKIEKYNTLLEQGNGSYFNLRLFSNSKGEIASIQRKETIESGLFSKKTLSSFILKAGESLEGLIIESYEGKQKVYVTDFNNWLATGDFKKSNYKIFDKSSGKTLATVAKKHAKANIFNIECEYDKNEPFIVLLAILIDIIN